MKNDSNLTREEFCCCPPSDIRVLHKSDQKKDTYRSGCMVCGEDLIYLENEQDLTCYFCGQVTAANARCVNGHFICDACHAADALEVIRTVCLHSQEANPVLLMQTIRSHQQFRIHGPKHHALVPAILLTALRNSGTPVTDEQIEIAIQRGQRITGGACAFMGACGAAVGVGIAVSLIIGASPYEGARRQSAQQATLAALEEIASFDAPRCCQRDSWLAIKKASKVLEEFTGTSLTISQIHCTQFPKNKECIHEKCPLWAEE